ncbi:MAG: cohesin domain-containing protein [Candidatus Magasanikbacteria bacterium]|nr:cohesin domain-containing protein [Candidatus Magasanikbacteria bacterium]
MPEKKIKTTSSPWFYAFIIAGAMFFGQSAHAASLYLSPSSGSYRVGQTFQVAVFVSSADQAMNTAQALVSFPPDKLEAVSVSTNNSIFSLMVENPRFTNNAGRINFSGIGLNPGYVGSHGRLVTINFKAKSIGQAKVSITNGQLLANDGDGSSIPISLGSGAYTILERKIVEPELLVTTTVNITTSTVCPKDHLPNIFLKINDLIFDQSALLLLLLLLMIIILAAISFWGFAEAFIHENKHHFKRKK